MAWEPNGGPTNIELAAEAASSWPRRAGLAVHPNFPASPYVYVLHTCGDGCVVSGGCRA
ncbi:MAG TPA: hypothetical protein VG846_05520 [Actinomycetota bacterium]|nr:hypothetical protein [Actinomycetota bacterium]